jgi:hypothetical protein
MAVTPPSSPTPAGDDRNLVAVDPTTALSFEDKLHLFWQKNRTIVIGLCVVVLVGIVAKGAWSYMARQKELEVEKAYSAATTTEQLKTFSAAHKDHTLGGIAQLRIADEAYLAAKSTDAIAAYEQALATLKTGPLAGRAKLGRALAKAQAGKGAEATTELKQVADDASQIKVIRAEAAYHLTSLAVDASNAVDAQKYVDQLNQLEPMGPWAQRAASLRATLPVLPAAAAPAPTTPAPAAPTAPEVPKKEEPGVKLNVPGVTK